MKLHPRYQKVDQGRMLIGEAIVAAYEKHDLTLGEMTMALSEELATCAKHIIRHERHPGNPNKKGDEA